VARPYPGDRLDSVADALDAARSIALAGVYRMRAEGLGGQFPISA